MFQMTALVAKYIFLALMMLFTGMGFYMYLKKPNSIVCRELFSYQTAIIVIFNILSFVIIILKEVHTAQTMETALEAGIITENAQMAGIKGIMLRFQQLTEKILPSWLRFSVVFTLLLYAGEMVFMYILLLTLHRHTNRLLWNCVFMLVSVGFVMLWRLDQTTARYQVYWLALCFIVINVVMLFFRGRWIWNIPVWLFLVASVGLIVLPFVFPYEMNGSLNWVDLFGFTFQPSEFVKIMFAFFLAVLYTKNRKLYSVMVAGAVTAFMALVLLIQRDLGTLLIFGILAWLMTYDYTGKHYVLWGGVFLVAIAGFFAYRLFDHVQVRFDIWIDPWADVSGQGYQIAQSLFAITDGGFFGRGLYQGAPGYIPARTTDMIFAVIVEEFGGVFAICLILTYLLMFLFVMETGRRERNQFRRNLLVAFGILFMSQTFIIVGGVIKLIPLTGVTLPFISYGGSSLLSNFITIGIIEAVIRLYRIDREEARKHAREGQIPQQIQGKQRIVLQPFEFGDPF